MQQKTFVTNEMCPQKYFYYLLILHKSKSNLRQTPLKTHQNNRLILYFHLQLNLIFTCWLDKIMNVYKENFQYLN